MVVIKNKEKIDKEDIMSMGEKRSKELLSR
jgi:hypothetical protein